MARDSLLDFFEDFANLDDTFVVHDDGYRVREQTYRQVAASARQFARQLQEGGLVPGDKVVIWSENRAEWIAALWGTLLAGGVLVPVDFRASGDLLARISGIVNARFVLVGEEVEAPAQVTGTVWRLADVLSMDPEPGLRHPERASRNIEPAAGAEPGPAHEQRRSPSPSDLAEIIFTSGATGDPKGVTITHRNLLANIVPIEREIAKYRRYERPFHPLRFLNLLPLSHMFGQSMATFIPPMLGGTVVFSHGYSPVEIVRQIRSRRISVLVVVPKALSVLREYVERELPDTALPDPLAGHHWSRRWWHYREAHRLFGWKFWCIVCGAAPLDADLEAFWRKLGFLVVQGYGLTETAPIVTLNHPFRASRGTVGTPIGGVEVRIAPDGEILVRGENVTAGYYKPEGAAATPDEGVFRDGWFHTGDIGELDASGRLTIKGRKKEMIVTPQGLNVFPEDVERALLAQPGVREAGVVGLPVAGEERIHAVLILEPGVDTDAVVRGANASLEEHQRVRSASVWPHETLPRTEGTQKLRRRELQRWASGATIAPTARPYGTTVADIVSRHAPGRTVTDGTTLEELGLSSLDRVELMMALEEAFHVTLDESTLAGPRTVRELEALMRENVSEAPPHPLAGDVSQERQAPERPGPAPHPGATRRPEPIAFPAWNRSGPAWLARRLSLPTWILPLGRVFMSLDVRGLEHLRDLPGPVIFASNHQSHMDTPAIFSALPPRWRYRVAPAMAKEFFKAHFNPQGVSRKEWFLNSLNYYLACQFFNAFPLPQREAGTRQTLRYIGEVLADGYSVLIFPEGKRSESGVVQPFRPGIGMIGSRLDVPVVPVRLEGLNRVLHAHMKFPKRGPVRVSFGAPLRLEGEDYAALAKQVEDAVRELGK
jgi:long-chain acyl-CoA synthetase